MLLSGKIRLLSGIVLALAAPLAAAHGLEAHSDGVMNVLRHLFIEHGYGLLMLVVVALCAYLLRAYERL